MESSKITGTCTDIRFLWFFEKKKQQNNKICTPLNRLQEIKREKTQIKSQIREEKYKPTPQKYKQL